MRDRKLKVLVVDDDALVRIALKSMIHWEDMGFILAGEAADGEAALRMIEQEEPDLVLLDVQMSRMDGIEVLKRMQYRSSPRFIVLSSHDKVDLVKNAIRLGAEDYILKFNTDFTLIEGVLEKIAGEIVQEQPADSGRNSGMDPQIYRNRLILRERFFRKIINESYFDSKSLRIEQEILSIRLQGNFCLVMVLMSNTLMYLEDPELYELRRFSIINIVEEVIDGYCFELDKGVFGAVRKSYENGSIDSRTNAEGETVKRAKNLGIRVRNLLYEYIDLSVVIGIATGENSIDGIRSAGCHAREVLQNRFFFEDDNVHIYLGNEENKVYDADYSVFSYRKDLFTGLDTGDETAVCHVFDRIIYDITQRNLYPDTIRMAVMNLYFLSREYFEQYPNQAQGIFPAGAFEYDSFRMIHNIQDARLKIGEIRECLLCYMKKQEEPAQYDRGLQTALDYMKENFNKDLSLQEVACQACLNASYFSNIMKKRFGKSYLDYLSDLRIGHAAELLRSSDYKVYEVGEMVGYPNPFYFSRIFKKKMGMTPGEYRSQLEEN